MTDTTTKGAQSQPTHDKRLVKWLLSHDTGSSSKAMVAVMEGIAPDDRFHGCHPCDGGDFGRCYRLLETIPEYREYLWKMRKVSPEWAVVIDHWEELESLYRQDGEMYKRMSQLFSTCRQREKVVDLGNGAAGGFDHG